MRRAMILAGAVLALVGCGGSGGDEANAEQATSAVAVTTTVAASTTTEPEPTTTARARPTTTVARTTTTTVAPTTTLPPTTTTTIPIISSGTYIVATEIAPGVYRVTGYYARLDAAQEIIENDIVSDGPTLMNVMPTDAYVEISGQALPIIASRPLNPVVEGFTDGTYLVGDDLPPGRYRITKEGGGSYYSRLDAAGEIIDNNISDGPVIVVVAPTDWALSISGRIESV